ncbi:MAG: molybdopterin-guanine dinucleotide biosynthesis protein B [Eubacteriales bacterium]|nr:molybdopterin-guanine dinucleotide biosynthesis protein B [Eubacteriales bacterium]
MSKKPYMFAVSGVKNSGKTTLITRLLPVLGARGIKTAVIKHDGHEFEADVPGTDTFAHQQAGAYGTAVFSDTRFMLVKQQQITEQELWRFFPEADLILLEGFKHSSYPKIEVVRQGNSQRCVCEREHLAAVAADFVPEGCIGIPVFSPDNIQALADVILTHMREEKAR